MDIMLTHLLFFHVAGYDELFSGCTRSQIVGSWKICSGTACLWAHSRLFDFDV